MNDLTSFLHTLPAPPPLEPISADERRIALASSTAGESRRTGLRGESGIIPPLTYTSSETFDVGLSDERGLKKFNPPYCVA